MKVSLITYHDEDNYGAILQAYATYRALKELDLDVEIIDFHLPNRQSLIAKIVFLLRRYRHQKFRKRFFDNKTRLYTSLLELKNNPPKSDCYIVGSDQTWNPEISKENAMAYFLDFGNDNVRRISYAASIGLSNWVENRNAPTANVQQILKKYHSILVREDRAVEICRDVFYVDAKQVIDPVLLFPSYPELTGSCKMEKGKMVIYKLIKKEDFYKKSAQIACKIGMYRVSVGSVRQIKGAKCPYPQSVDKWVKHFATAELVFTDSFHGTVLSILYHKQFVIYLGDPNRASRLTSLLASLGLSDRICASRNSLDYMIEIAERKIDYQIVDKRLANLRLDSINLLKEALS